MRGYPTTVDDCNHNHHHDCCCHDNDVIEIEFDEMPSFGLLNIKEMYKRIFKEAHPWNVS